MKLATQIAKHFRDVYFGGNWTSVSLKDALADLSWQQATTSIYSLNSIAALVFHVNYYVSVVSRVLQGEPLKASDKYSFDMPPIQSEGDWQQLLNKLWTDAESFVALIEQLPDSKMGEIFENEKYGTYYRNLHGIIEHTHYHLGQMVLIKKILVQQDQKEG